MTENSNSIPSVDLAEFSNDRQDALSVAAEIRQACREFGFFYIIGHGVSEELQSRLEQLSRQFFALDLEAKLQIRMERGGRAWRGYFPVGAELTLGQPDQKEGLYFGAELDDDHPKVKADVPLVNARILIHDDNDLALHSLYTKAGMPERYYAAFCAAIDIAKETEFERSDSDPDWRHRLILERMLTQFEEPDDEFDVDDIDYLLNRLSRIEAQATTQVDEAAAE